MIVIPELFRSIVTKVDQIVSGLPTPFNAYYSYGHYAEVTKTISQKNNSITLKDKKYPLIWLVMDFEESFIPFTIGYCKLPNLQFIIANQATADKTTEQRFSENFVPILYPAYQNFIKCIANSGLFYEQNVNEIEHTKIDRPYWGLQDNLSNNTANLFNEFVDAIQIKNMKLTVQNERCI